ncbi:MAG: hypothetical protein IT436_19115 [Phycisphaerales bacterium]|nr:hypothetical protein [Phycisphaerales bacterium]
MKNRFLTVSALLLTAGLASVAQAAPPTDGDLVFSDEFSDAVYHLPQGMPADLLFAVPDSRLAGITRIGSDWFISDGPFPVLEPSNSRIIKATALFSGAPVVTTFASSGDIQNPIGITYHSGSNSIVGVMNPGKGPPKFDGLLSINSTGTATTRLFEEPNPNITPSPRYNAGAYIVQDVNRGNRFLVTCSNGGIDTPDPTQDRFVASTLHAFTIGDDLTTTHDYIYDFSSSSTGLAETLFEVRGMTIAGDNVFVSDVLRGEIYKLTLDGTGAVSGISLLLAGLDQPESLIYNPFTNKLIIDEAGELDPTRARISQINLDGTGYEVLANGFHARGFAIVPTPGSLALLGLGGLMAGRRRRA